LTHARKEMCFHWKKGIINTDIGKMFWRRGGNTVAEAIKKNGVVKRKHKGTETARFSNADSL